jgi:hypothetical protein
MRRVFAAPAPKPTDHVFEAAPFRAHAERRTTTMATDGVDSKSPFYPAQRVCGSL